MVTEHLQDSASVAAWLRWHDEQRREALRRHRELYGQEDDTETPA